MVATRTTRPGMAERLALMILAMSLAIGAAAGAAGTPGQECAARKITAAGKKAACLLSLDARAARGGAVDPVKVQKCKDKLGDPMRGAFAKAEERGGCLTTGDASGIEDKVDAFADGVDMALNVGTPNACQAAKLKAAGKTASCLLTLRAKAATGAGLDPTKVQACTDRLSGPAGTFARKEVAGGCATTGDASTIEDEVEAFVDEVVGEEPAVATCATAGCPAPVACDPSAGACWQLLPVQAIGSSRPRKGKRSLCRS